MGSTSSSQDEIKIVGRTHTIVRLQTRIRRKDGTENFGGFVYVLDGFPQRDFVLWVFMCPINFSLFRVSIFLFCLFFCLFSGYHAEGYHAPSIPHWLSRPGLPLPILTSTGYHACVYIPVITPGLSRSRLPRPILTTTGYHACVYIPVITPELSRSNTHVHRVITPAIVVRIL